MKNSPTKVKDTLFIQATFYIHKITFNFTQHFFLMDCHEMFNVDDCDSNEMLKKVMFPNHYFQGCIGNMFIDKLKVTICKYVNVQKNDHIELKELFWIWCDVLGVVITFFAEFSLCDNEYFASIYNNHVIRLGM